MYYHNWLLNWFYVIIRTYPFWAVPLGIFLALVGIRQAGKKKFLFGGISLIVTGVAFLFLKGPFYAVPFMHEMLNYDYSNLEEAEESDDTY